MENMTEVKDGQLVLFDLPEVEEINGPNIFIRVGNIAINAYNRVPKKIKRAVAGTALGATLIYGLGPQVLDMYGDHFGHHAASTIKNDLSNYSGNLVSSTVDKLKTKVNEQLPGFTDRELSLLNGDIVTIADQKYELVFHNGHLSLDPESGNNSHHTISASPPTGNS